MQINPRAGLTFATALRSILRSDPDVVMVGEIRDVETAKISIESALTGHFVLSTLHTNDAPGTITRLNEMGVEPFLTARPSPPCSRSGSRASCARVAWRSTSRATRSCAPRACPSTSATSTDGAPSGAPRAVPGAANTGYRGRVGIFQLLRMSEELESLAARARVATRSSAPRGEGGMRPLWEDGLRESARAGVTSVEELARVLV